METPKRKLGANITPTAVVAFALGTAIGWGSLVVTSSTYLAQSGLMGSVIGMVIAMIVMIVITRNYSYLIMKMPDAGGAYAYSRDLFGCDYGFLTAWFLSLTYLSVLWANATSVPLFVRYFLGEILHFGKLYTIFGYDIYIGEILATVAALGIVSFICTRSNNIPVKSMIVLAAVFTFTILVVSVAALMGHRGSWEPLYVPEADVLSQIARIAVISPWAYIGFECVSHSAEEYSFDRKKIFPILVVSVVVVTILYIAITALSMTAYPERYSSWLEYIRDRGNLEGLEALPAFYAANYYMGNAGVWMLMAALLSLVISSLFGNIFTLSRLFFALGRDDLLPEKYAELNDKGVPYKAVKLVLIVSLFIPLVGRTAIGWIVDVTTIGATLIYGLVAASATRKAHDEGDETDYKAGSVGLALMVGYSLYTLLNNLFAEGSIAKETFFLFIVWSIFGFFMFRMVLGRDTERKYGQSIVVWAAMLSLLLFISVVWMRQSMVESTSAVKESISEYYEEVGADRDINDEQYVVDQLNVMEEADTRAIIVTMAMFSFAVLIMFSNHSYMNKRARESERIAGIDSMTGLRSKYAYMNLEREYDAKISKGIAEDFALIVCDVNELKHINDTLGHRAGDAVIIKTAEIISHMFKYSTLYRVGGDEFLVMLEGEDYNHRDNLLKTFHEMSESNIGTDNLVISVGMSEYNPKEDVDFHTVFERADERMYEHKMELKQKGSKVRD